MEGLGMVGFPLLLIPLAVYNIVVWLMPGVSLADPLIKLTLMSGTEWSIDLSDMLLALAVFLLLLEVIKGARPGAKFLTDHLLSLIVFGAAAAEFVLWPRFGNSTFFLLALLSLADFLSGIALRARRGTVPAVATVPRRGARAPAAASEPRFDPEPAPIPSAAPPVIETRPTDHAEPKGAPAEIPPASPAVTSPGLQPSEGTAPSPDTPPR
jgi:hypothetical protein